MLAVFFYYGGLSVLALRLALAAIFIVHGWGKLRDIKKTAAWFGSIGFRPGIFWGALAALLEFFGGLSLAAGFLVQPLAALFALEFLTILAWRILKKMPFVGGWELDLLILGGVIVLLGLGSGSYAIDRIFSLGLF